jgi:hypothetical protein
VIASGNTRHFCQINERFPLPGLFNPFDQTWPVTPAAAS